MTFFEWLKKQQDRNNEIGDFAIDVYGDGGVEESKLKNFKKSWLNYLELKTNWDLVLLAFENAWEEYDLNRKNKKMVNRIKSNCRSRLYMAIKNKSKKGSSVKDLGCTIEEFQSYLEKKFKDGMTWKNYGFRGWHIDHIKPLALFDLTNRTQFLEAVHYSNLQPLWWRENISKGKKLL